MAAISVYCQFPKYIVPNTELDLHSENWDWAVTLAFPVTRLNELEFSPKPYKWMRYATGIVVGAHGELCAERDNCGPINYDDGLPTVGMDLYYHTSDQEKLRMFPIDSRFADSRRVTSSGTSMRRDNFREDVEGRDGICVVTGAPADLCDACHLLPHSKGDTYVEAFTTHRCRDSSGDNDIIRDINDLRNGLFLNVNIHRALGRQVAFLRTPNFAMDTTDVVPNADPAQETFTHHVFDQSLEGITRAGCSGSALRVPSDMSTWPPPALFDAVYASAVMRHFGIAIEDVLKRWEGVFYPEGTMEAAHTNDERRRDHADAEKDDNPRQRRHGRCGGRDAINPHDIVMMYRFLAMEPENVRAYLNGCEEMATAAERKAVEEKVNSWRKSLAPGTAVDDV